MKRALALCLLFLPVFCFADVVVPIDKVRNAVNVRLSPDASSDVVGQLKQGDSMVLVGSEAGWHEVALEGGATGYISADWTKVIDDAEIVTESTVADTLPETAVAAVEDAIVAVVPSEAAIEEEVAAVEGGRVSAIQEVTEAAAETPVPIAEPDRQPLPDPGPTPIQQVTPEPAIAQTEIQGTENFLIKFRDKNKSGNSQIFDNGNQIGIGTTDPKQRLEVNGSIQIHEQNSSVAGLMITQSTGDTGYIMHNRASTLTIGAGSQDRITIDHDGNVGIGVSRPSHPLEMASGAHVTAGGAWTNSSSRAHKENIEPLNGEKATATVMALQPVQFSYKNERAEDYVGFIAEDVPELVATKDRDSLSTMDIVAVLTKVVQEQQVRIEELEARLDEGK